MANIFEKNNFTVLSLFDGMSCGQIALQKAGIEVKQYFASEIDKYAIQVTQSNFPNTIQLGNVTKIKGIELPKIDLLIGGSPCQGFSSFGKGLNFEDERSKLFFEFVRLKNELQPTHFLMENVTMKYEYEIIISKYLGVEPIFINSSLLSAQSRERAYWTNINAKPFGLFGELKADIPQPKDKGILLSDILEDKPFRKITNGFYKNWGGKIRIDKGLNWTENKKGNCITTKNCHPSQYLLNKEKNMFRLLTALELERLQTIPDNYTNAVADTHRHKMLGNGWTIDVIAYIFSFLGREEKKILIKKNDYALT